MKLEEALEKLLKKIEVEPLEDCLTETEIKYLTELEYLKSKDFEPYVKYYHRYEQIKNNKIKENLNELNK